MVLEMFLIDEVLLLSLYAALCFVDTSDTSKYISWYCLIFLAISSSSWLTQASFVILDVLHLLVHDFLIEFVLEFSSCLKHRSFPSYIPLHCLSMLDHPLFPILSGLLVLLYYSSGFLLIIWFLLPSGFLWTLLFQLLCLSFLSIVFDHYDILVVILCVYLIFPW